MISLSFWFSLEKKLSLENNKMILPDSIDWNVVFGAVIHAGASMMTLGNTRRK